MESQTISIFRNNFNNNPFNTITNYPTQQSSIFPSDDIIHCLITKRYTIEQQKHFEAIEVKHLKGLGNGKKQVKVR